MTIFMNDNGILKIQLDVDIQLKSIKRSFWKKLEREVNKTIEYLETSSDDQTNKLIKSIKLIPKINKPLSPLFSCKKGCSTCCEYSEIGISIIEAEYINKNIKHSFSFQRYPSISKEHNNPCPFLINNQCSIYDFRPLVCRTYHVFTDPINCKPGGLSFQYGSATNNPPFSHCFLSFIVNYFRQDNIVADIRDFFQKI